MTALGKGIAFRVATRATHAFHVEDPEQERLL